MIITLLTLINIQRIILDTQPLIESSELNQRAQIRAEQLCKDKQWSHDGWTESFEGIKWDFIGENLARDFMTDIDTHISLMNSPTHRYNILSSNFNQLGIGRSADCNLTVELFSN